MNPRGFNNTGKILMTCVDCRTARMWARKEFLRAKLPACPACGSRFLEESKSGHEKLARGQAAAAEQEAARHVGPRP